jgi:hypothetical protein
MNEKPLNSNEPTDGVQGFPFMSEKRPDPNELLSRIQAEHSQRGQAPRTAAGSSELFKTLGLFADL